MGGLTKMAATKRGSRYRGLKGLLLACAVTGACSDSTEPSVVLPAGIAGEWSGTTSQGMGIAFTVSADERVTAITIGHRFNGCEGLQAFPNLDLSTVREVICVPGPCSPSETASRSFGFASDRRQGPPNTSVFGIFLPGNQAQGQANFSEFAGCGSAIGVGWSAKRR